MKLSDIWVRDPFILPYDGMYYLYRRLFEGQEHESFLCYMSRDLVEWSEPVCCFEPPQDFWADENFWAPEVHVYNGAFYMFATFYKQGKMRATQILKADRPEGPFFVWSEPITPQDWMCLDGTLYVENGVPYIVFCHEWLQVKDGEMCVQQLSDDLKTTVGEPRVLFCASQSPHTVCIEVKDVTLAAGYITDGPFLRKTADGKLLMIWSSYGKNGYIEAVAISENGSIHGEWKHCEHLLSDKNGGHGMLFTTFDGTEYFVMHAPNEPHGAERPRLVRVTETDKEPYLQLIEDDYDSSIGTRIN